MEQGGYSDEYLVKKDGDAGSVQLVRNGTRVARLAPDGGYDFKLVADSQEWILTNRVHGEYRPFSLSILRSGNEVLTIRDHLFKYRDRFYMMTNHPQGQHWSDYVNSGTRYICRMDNLPLSDLASIKPHIKHEMKKFRGKPVAEISGLTADDGHLVKVGGELKEIGLLVAAASHLLYSQA